jgi:hypothetical protein
MGCRIVCPLGLLRGGLPDRFRSPPDPRACHPPASLWPAAVAASVISREVPAASSCLSSPDAVMRSHSLRAPDREVPSAAASRLAGRTPESSMISNARS